MEFVSVGLYREHLVRYGVVSSDDSHYVAMLLRYKGNMNALPPKEIIILRNGNNWFSNADGELMAFLVHDITSWLRKEKNSKKEKAKHHEHLAHNSFASAIHEITYRRH